MIDELKRQTGENGRDDVNDALARVAAVRSEYEAEWEPHFTSSETPISPYRVIRELEKAVDVSNTIITHDSG